MVLRDGEGKEIILAAKDVEELRPSRASLMPDGQLAEPDRPGSGRPARVSLLPQMTVPIAMDHDAGTLTS